MLDRLTLLSFVFLMFLFLGSLNAFFYGITTPTIIISISGSLFSIFGLAAWFMIVDKLYKYIVRRNINWKNFWWTCPGHIFEYPQKDYNAARSHRVLIDEVNQWCNENCNGRWLHSHGPYFVFQKKSDLLAAKITFPLGKGNVSSI